MAKNSIELIGIFGDDLTHALAAWTSTSRELTDDKRARHPKLLRELASAGHHTPFEHSQIQFLVTADIATHIQCVKHRIGVSINGESARYKELKEDRYYVPTDWTDEAVIDKYVAFMERSMKLYHELVADLTPKLGRKRAKESARFVRPYGTQLTWVMTFNFRSFMHLQGLRNSTHAQLEIRDISRDMLRIVRESGRFDASLQAFGWSDVNNVRIETVAEKCCDCGRARPG